jgi:hypothetical protein
MVEVAMNSNKVFSSFTKVTLFNNKLNEVAFHCKLENYD